MSKIAPFVLLLVLCGDVSRATELPVVEEVPILGIFKERRPRGSRTFVTIRSPAIRGVAVDLWCYEDEFGLPKEIDEREDRIILHHQFEGYELKTLFEAEPGGVRITATLTGPDGEWLPGVQTLNMCMTHQRSAAFGNRKDKFDESYLEDFVGRAFVFLESGLRRLADTNRVPSVDSRDNPYSRRGSAANPWVQEYAPRWRSRSARLPAFFGRRPVSTDRPTYPIMGVISQDERFLSAFAWPDAEYLGQLFISCLHPNSRLAESCLSEPEGCVTRGKIYLMENNPQRLLKLFERDFPDWERPPDVD